MERLLHIDSKMFGMIPLLLFIMVSVMSVDAKADEFDQSGAGHTDVNVTALARQIAFVKSFSIAYPYQYSQKADPGVTGIHNVKKTRKK